MKKLYKKLKSLHIGKKINLSIMYVIFSIAIISIITSDNHDVTKKELKSFYNAKMDSCLINEVRKVKYPGRGFYNIFRTNCRYEFYPVMLVKGDRGLYEYFTKNTVISKKSKSYELKIWKDSRLYNATIRNPKDEGVLSYFIGIVVFVAILTTIIILAIPDSKYDKMMNQLKK